MGGVTGAAWSADAGCDASADAGGDAGGDAVANAGGDAVANAGGDAVADATGDAVANATGDAGASSRQAVADREATTINGVDTTRLERCIKAMTLDPRPARGMPKRCTMCTPQ